MADLPFINSGGNYDLSRLVVRAPLSDVDAIYRRLGDVLKELASTENFASIGDGLDWAVANSTKLLVHGDLTVNVPSDAATLQGVFDSLTVLHGRVTVNIETTEVIDTALVLENGDWSRFVITAADAEVDLAASFSGTIISGRNAQMPVLDCLIDATNQIAGNGIEVYDASSMHITAGSGVKNAWGTGLLARYGARVSANDTVFTNADRANSGVSAGITAWGSTVDAQGADTSGSNGYGAQAAHSGCLNFREGTADNCSVIGIRGTDGAMVSADAAQANNCGVRAIIAFNGSHIAANNFVGTGSSQFGAVAAGASTLHIRGGDVSGAGTNGILCTTASMIDAHSCDAQKGGSPSASDIEVSAGGVICATLATGGLSQTANTIAADGIIFQ